MKRNSVLGQPDSTKVVSSHSLAALILVGMTRRVRQLMYILAATVPAASLFVLFPNWEIEHPSDPSLILRSERHFLWNRPAHAHVDAIAMAIPVIAIIIVAIALFVVVLRNE